MPQSLKPWNWQLPGWPEFVWHAGELRPAEAEFLHRSGVHVGVFTHLSREEQDDLRAELLSDEALLTSRIEGEILDRDSLQSSIRQHFGLATDHRKTTPAEAGISELMLNVYQNHAKPLDDARLFAWHRMVMRGRTGLRSMGGYRTGDDPMQVVSGPVHDPVVHFEAPPSARVPLEMRRFLSWFNSSTGSLDGVTRAGIAHLWFESIHPFEDGNGRMGRAISEIALSRALGRPSLIALSSTLESRRKGYYEELGRASRSLEITPWLTFFAAAVLDAQQSSLAKIEFLVRKARFFERFRECLNDRQEKAVLRIFREGVDGFKGGMSSKNYVSITRCSPATATRDLAALVAWGAMTRTGERKHARYFLKLGE
jgi:Fic family protein